MPVCVPNFFIVGAARSGTTALAHYLGEHPQVYMSPIKEPSYFARDIIDGLQPPGWKRNQRGLDRYLNGPMAERRGGCVLDWESYLKLFRNASSHTAIGEASTAYLISPAAPGEIRSRIPEARIIIMLRSPIERAVSTYRMFCSSGRLRAPFSDVLHSAEGARLSEWRRWILETRKIAPGVERFLRTFPRDRVRWYLHESLTSEPLAVLQNVYSFLGIDAGFKADIAQRYNEARQPRFPLLHRAAQAAGVWWIVRHAVPRNGRDFLHRMLFRRGAMADLSPQNRAVLVEYFREDVNRLGQLLAMDFSFWLKT